MLFSTNQWTVYMNHDHYSRFASIYSESVWRSWLRIWSISFAVLIFVLAIGNYLIDPFDVYETNLYPKTASTNERYRKLKHVLKHKNQIQGLLMGSSVMGLCRTSSADAKTGKRFYNLGFLGGMPIEMLRTLKALKDNGYQPKIVVISIDLFQFREPTKVDSAPFRYLPPAVTGEAHFVFLGKYLFAGGPYSWYKKITSASSRYHDYSSYLEEDGHYEFPRYEHEIHENHPNFIKRRVIKNAMTAGGVTFIPDRFEELKALKKWLDLNGIEQKYYFSPMNPSLYDLYGTKALNNYSEQVRAILGEVYDYRKSLGLNENFYDDMHYRPAVCDQIFNEILG